MTGGRSGRGLDWLNFFMANVQTGFGPFIAVYLTTRQWTEVEIGFALSVGTLTTMLSQVPAGALVDATRRKRRAAAVAVVSLAASALLLAVWPATVPVLLSEVLHGIASCVLAPSIAAISLALVGRAGLGERLGRNARFAAAGGGIAAAVMGIAGTYVSAASVFWLTAALCVPSLVALGAIRQADLARRVEAVQEAGRRAGEAGLLSGGLSGLRHLLGSRGVLVFTACCGLFTLANAAMLPLAGTRVTQEAGDEANLIIAACIVVPQLVVVLISPWVGRLAESRGRRLVLLAGFAALPLRGLLLALVTEPAALIVVQVLDGISAAVMGVLLPLLAADLTRGTNRFNLCMGLFGLAVGLGGTLSTAIAGLVTGWFGAALAFNVLGGIGLVACLLVLAMPETRPAPDDGGAADGG
ncbi:MFS transporter [Roseomonas sp. NAR14]|uniref:MFS transporter n=1 Tax=Roseomonas acroporae TaxID=2937791 RepID=A0A9X2BV02_9PROT|nr:MFS transporter [Roseomonas acroporae]MCK8783509.1 MFS transporter [Roseomonas acroporae]